jgi:hypothetical protein
MSNDNFKRQGDVPMIRISKEIAEKMISGAKPANREAGRIVLAYGETSGHMHAIEHKDALAFPVRVGTVIVVPVGGAELKHIDQSGALTLEHSSINLEEGYWLRVKQREFTLQGNRDVTD